MVVAFQGHSYVMNTSKTFLNVPSFTVVYLLGVCTPRPQDRLPRAELTLQVNYSKW